MGYNIFFNGVDSYLTVNSSSGSFGTSDFTIEAYLKITEVSGTKCVFNNYNVYNTNSLGLFAPNSSATNKYSVVLGSSGFPNISSTSRPNTKTFDHVALCRSANTFTLFVNGALEGTTTFTGNLTHSFGEIRIGNDASNGSNFYDGWIKGFRVIKNEALYKQTITVPSTQLPNTAGTDTYYSNTYILLHGNGTNGSNNILNNGNGNVSITVSGNTSMNTAQVKFGNASIYFDGSSDYITLIDQTSSSNVELITNGDFSNGSNSWTLSGAATVSGNVLSVSGGANFAYQTNVIQANKLYEISFDMTYSSGSSIRINNVTSGGSGDGVIWWPVTNGKVSGRFTAGGTAISIEARNAVFTGTIDNVSVKLVENDIRNLNDSSKDVTFEAWIYPVVLSSWQYDATVPIFFGYMSSSPTDTNNNWSFGPMSDGTVRFYYYNGAQNTISSPDKILANQWSHIAFSKTSKGITLWVNGKGYGPVAISGTITSSSSNFIVGKYYNAGGINGYVDDLRYTYGDARYVYSGFTPPSVLTLTPNTTLLTCNTLALNANNQCRDQSNLNYTVTTFGDVGLGGDGIDLVADFDTASSNLLGTYSFSNAETSNISIVSPSSLNSILLDYEGDGTIFGTVKKRIAYLNIKLANTKVYLYTQDQKTLLKETTSNTTGHYSFTNLNKNKKFFVTCFDPQLQKNAVIADNITPE